MLLGFFANTFILKHKEVCWIYRGFVQVMCWYSPHLLEMVST